MRSVTRAILMLIILMVGVPAGAQNNTTSEAQNFIWFEARLGHVFVGPADQPGPDFLAYGYYFVAIGPEPNAATEQYGNCIRSAVERSAENYRRNIAAQAATWPDQPLYYEKDPANLRRVGPVLRTRDAVVTARGEYKRFIVQYCRHVPLDVRNYFDETSLGIVKRECANLTCNDPALPPVGGLDTSQGRVRETIFEATHYWVMNSKLDLGTGLVIKLDTSQNGGLEPSTVEVVPAASWPALIPAQERFTLFEKRAARIYRARDVLPMSATVTDQIELPKPSVLRLAGAFRKPGDAYALAASSAEITLGILQDEVARIRVRECHDYRGKPELADVAKCAGYALKYEEMLNCLGSGKCMPVLSGEVQAGAMLMSARTSIEDLAKDSILPRPFSEAAGGFKKLTDDLKACSAALSITGQPNSEQIEQIKGCVGDRAIPADLMERADCLRTKPQSEKVACVLSGDERQRVEQLSACIQQSSSICVLEAALPPEVACIGKARSLTDLGCLGPLSEAAKAAQCLSDHADTDDYIAKVRCVAGSNIPPAASKMLDCYSTSSTKEGFALCAAGASLPEKEARLIKCAVQSGGNYVSAGVCMAVPNLGLNPGQQILLQCAVSSGGVPLTFAGCAVGQFTLRELMGCRSTDFGQSGCFGDGNEIQKLARAITGDEISSNSVVGQVVTAHISYINGVISGYGQVASQLGEGSKNLEEGFRHELEKIKERPLEALADAPANIVRESQKVVENVGREAGKGACRAANWLPKCDS